jgi:hypothetical protein
MKRKTQCFAFALKCEGFAVRGEAARASFAKMSARARLAKPPPACSKKSLRVDGAEYLWWEVGFMGYSG